MTFTPERASEAALPRSGHSSLLKKVIRPRNWPLHAQTGRANTRHQNQKKRARRLPPFAAADLDAKRPVFDSKHPFQQADRRRGWLGGGCQIWSCILAGVLLVSPSLYDTKDIAAQSLVEVGEVRDRFGAAWRWRLHGRDERLRLGTATALYQDQKNFVYAATHLGIFRYDLWFWEQLAPQLADEVLTFAESNSVVYACSRSVLWKLRGDRLEVAHQGDELLLAVEADRNVFLIDGESRKHYQIHGEVLDLVDGGTLPSGNFFGYAVAPDGRHWLIAGGDLYSRDLREPAWVPLEPNQVADALVNARCERLYRVAESQVPRRRRIDRPPSTRPGVELWGLFKDSSQGRTVLGALRDDEWVPLKSGDDVPRLKSVKLQHGGLYYAITDDGEVIASADAVDWQQLPLSAVGESSAITSLVDTSGFFWFSLGGGGVATFDPDSDRWTQLPVGGRRVQSLIEATTGDGWEVWAGTDRGVWRYRVGEETQSWPSAQGTELRRVTGLCYDEERERVWVTSEQFSGMLYFDGTNWQRFRAPAIGDDRFIKVVNDFTGELWFLPRSRSGEGQPRFYRLLTPPVDAIQVVRSNEAYDIVDLIRTNTDELFLATNRGLLNGRVVNNGAADSHFEVMRAYSVEDGLLGPSLWSVTRALDGAIWVSYRGESSEVTRISPDGSVTSFSGAGGPVWSITPVGADLYFGTDYGLTRFDGVCFYRQRVASAGLSSGVWPVVVSREIPDSLLVGTLSQGIWRFRNDDDFRPRFSPSDLPATVLLGEDGTGRETFEWDARDYRAQSEPQDLQFRTRFDGDDWTLFSGDRMRILAGMPPGEHTFEIEVRDLDGNPSRGPYLHEFSVRPRGGDSELLTRLALGAVAIALLVGVLFMVSRSVARRRRVERYVEMFRTCPFPVFILDDKLRVVDYNGASPELIELDEDSIAAVIGRPLRLLPAFSHEQLGERLKRMLSGEGFFLREHQWLRGGVVERLLAVQGFPFIDEAGIVTGGVVLVEDKTDSARVDTLRERERRLASLRSMAKELTSGLHDLTTQLKDGASGAAVRNIERLESMIASLSVFSEDSVGFRGGSELSLNELLQGLLESENGVTGFGQNVRVDFRAQAGLWTVQADVDRIKEAVLEILRNAADAMPEEGLLKIRTANVRLEYDEPILQAGTYVELAIADTGIGMASGHRERAVEPFFTTKAREESLGVGLSLAYGVVRSHGGDLRIDSSPGQGTIVRVLLPAAHR